MTTLVVEKYGRNGAQNQYYADGTMSKYQNRRFSNLYKIFQQIFLPQGYPESVSKDYLEYQIWDTLQAFASSVTGTLASQAMLKGYGVGDEKATVLAATITWLLKDGAGMVGRILFAWSKGTFLDCDCKRWRLFADILNDAAIFLELQSPLYPTLFTPIACTASVAKSLVGVAGGATRSAIGTHQARRNNMADVTAKDGSQETMVNLMALIFNFAFIHLVTGHSTLIWTSYVVFTILHLFANYRAVRCLRMETFNLTRYLLFTRAFLRSGGKRVLNVTEGNRCEPVVFPIPNYSRIHLGSSFSTLAKNHVLKFTEIVTLFRKENFLLVPKPNHSSISVILHEEASDADILKAILAAEIFFFAVDAFQLDQSIKAVECVGYKIMKPIETLRVNPTAHLLTSTLKVSNAIFGSFLRSVQNTGWDLSALYFGTDEWRCDWRLSQMD